VSGNQTSVVDVLLASDLQLIADAVAAALRSRGFRTTVLHWSGVTDASVRQQVSAAAADVSVLLYDVDMSVRMAAAGGLLRAAPGPWLVLTGTPPGPAWGGLGIEGAAAVRPRDLTLEDTDTLIRSLAARTTEPSVSLAEQVHAWRVVQERHGRLQQRLDSLAPRQLQVLTLLYEGVQVAEIARRLGLAEATVRSQVHSVLRKRGVRCPLAAVALLHAIDQPVTDQPHSTGGRQSTS